MRNNRTAFALLLCCVSVFISFRIVSATAAGQDFSLEVKNAQISARTSSVSVTKVNGYDRVRISGLDNHAEPGQPLLPFKTVKYLIPYGKTVADVNVGWTRKKLVYGTFLVEPAQAPIAYSNSGPIELTKPDPAVYSQNSPFPRKPFEVVFTQKMRGYEILIINLFPVEYIPAAGQLFYYENLNLNITLSGKLMPLSSDKFSKPARANQMVLDFVDNPQDIDSFPTGGMRSLAPEDPDYLIITNNAFATHPGTYDLAALIAHKTGFALNVLPIVTTDGPGGIYATYPAGDNAQKIRDYLKDFYDPAKIQYVLLVGDADDRGGASGETEAAPIIPYRGLYGIVNAGTVDEEEDDNIPADLYYSCLEGDYDFNNNGIYGELNDGDLGGPIDLTPDIYVGRAPVDSETELENFVKKTIAYETSAGSAYLNKVCMAGELLDNDPVVYGKSFLEQIRHGSSADGVITAGMAETGYFSYNLLYAQNSSWIKSQLIDLIDSGIHVLNHLAHASTLLFSQVAGINNTDIDGLRNTDYFFGYTQGCYSGAFDNKNEAGDWETEDCVLEHFTTGPNGAFAFIGNSRYGWYTTADYGPSQRFHREFWDAVVAEGITNIGRALADAKLDTIGLVSSYGGYRWSYFATNLLGDPHTPLNGDFLSPTNFSANNIAFSNNGWVTLSWRNSIRYNLTHVMIRYRTDGTYPTSETDGTLLLSKTVTPGSTETYNHKNVQSGTTYHYVAFGYDGTAYEGADAATNRGYATVLQGSSSNSDDSSDCFVATACFNDQNASEVMHLRKFRDSCLMKNQQGREFVSLYYLAGPKLAVLINNNLFAKKIARCSLMPIVRIAQWFNTQGK